MQALPMSPMVRHNFIWALHQLPSLWCKCVAGWARWSSCIIIIKQVEHKRAINGIEGGRWLSTHTLQMPIWPSGGHGPHIGRPNPKMKNHLQSCIRSSVSPDLPVQQIIRVIEQMSLQIIEPSWHFIVECPSVMGFRVYKCLQVKNEVNQGPY